MTLFHIAVLTGEYQVVRFGPSILASLSHWSHQHGYDEHMNSINSVVTEEVMKHVTEVMKHWN